MSIDIKTASGRGPAPVVFLDFDGVTHPECCKTERLFTSVPLIEEVLRRHTSVEVVISSSWREHHPLSELRAFFSHDMSHRVVGVTPVAPRHRAEPSPAAVRETECLTWLAANRPDHPWIAIDDVPWIFSPGCPNLLLTHHRVGFTQLNADQLHSILERLSS